MRLVTSPGEDVSAGALVVGESTSRPGEPPVRRGGRDRAPVRRTGLRSLYPDGAVPFTPAQETEHAMADAETEAKPADQDALVADIDRTRAELARTIDAISDRLSPRTHVRRATDQIRERVSHTH